MSAFAQLLIFFALMFPQPNKEQPCESAKQPSTP